MMKPATRRLILTGLHRRRTGSLQNMKVKKPKNFHHCIKWGNVKYMWPDSNTYSNNRIIIIYIVSLCFLQDRSRNSTTCKAKIHSFLWYANEAVQHVLFQLQIHFTKGTDEKKWISGQCVIQICQSRKILSVQKPAFCFGATSYRQCDFDVWNKYQPSHVVSAYEFNCNVLNDVL